MMLLSLVALGLTMFLKVFLMGFQSKNVVGNHYKTAFCTSVIMGLVEVLTITEIVYLGWWSILPVSIGGSIGIVISMYCHTKLFTPKDVIKVP